MLQNPQPSPWIFAPISYCWDWNVFSKSKLILKWNHCTVRQEQCGWCLGTHSTWNEGIKELCWKACLHNVYPIHCGFLFLMHNVVCSFSKPTSHYSVMSGPNKIPQSSTHAPDFSARGEHLYWSLPVSLFFSETHFNATLLVKFFYTGSTPSYPNTHAHAHTQAHSAQMWWIPLWNSEYFEPWAWHSSHSAFWSCVIWLR